MSVVPDGHDGLGAGASAPDAPVPPGRGQPDQGIADSTAPNQRELITADMAAGLFLVVWGVFWSIKGYGYGLRGSGGIAGAGFVPFYLGVALILMGAGIGGGAAVRRLRARRQPSGGNHAMPAETVQVLRRLALCAVLVVAFVGLIAVLGFEVASILFIASMIRLFSATRRTTLLLYSLAATIVVSFVFRFLLDLSMPVGVFSSVAERIAGQAG